LKSINPDMIDEMIKETISFLCYLQGLKIEMNENYKNPTLTKWDKHKGCFVPDNQQSEYGTIEIPLNG